MHISGEGSADRTVEWRDGFGTWAATPDTEVADGPQVTFADDATVIGDSGHIAAPDTSATVADADDVAVRWSDGFGDWATS